MGKNLSVATTCEPVSSPRQILTNLVVIVKLSVLNGPHGPVLARDRLVSHGHVDNAQSAHDERDARRTIDATVIRPPMRHRIGHPVEHALLDYLSRFSADLNYAADTAH